MQDVSNGSERARAWPRGRGRPKTKKQLEAQQKFAAAQLATKYLSPTMYADIIKARAGTPLLPRDVMTALFYQRLCMIVANSGRKLWPMTARIDVSQALDVINQDIGKSIIRGPLGWEPYEPSGGGGSNWWFDPPAAADFPLLIGTLPLALSDDADEGLLIDGGPGVTGDVSRAALKSVGTNDFDIAMRCTVTAFMVSSHGCGLSVFNSATPGRLSTLYIERSPNTSIAVVRWTLPAGFNSSPQSNQGPRDAVNWLRITRTAGVLTYYYSTDGKMWLQLHQELESSWTGPVTHIGPSVTYNNNTAQAPIKLSIQNWTE